MERINKFVAVALSVSMIFQTGTFTTLAAEHTSNTVPKTVSSFSELEKKEYGLALGAEQAEIDALVATFPAELTAQVQSANEPAGEVQPEGTLSEGVSAESAPSKDTLTESALVEPVPPVDEQEGQDTVPGAEQPEQEQENSSEPVEEISLAAVELAEEPKQDTASGSEQPEQPDQEVEAPDGEQESSKPEEPSVPTVDEPVEESDITEELQIPVTWESDKPLTTEAAGEFVYTAVITDKDRFQLAEGVKMPTITVHVLEKLANADAAVTIDESTFPDPQFRAFVEGLLGGDDGSFTQEEIANIISVDCENRGISDLTGIEHFTALSTLKCGNNPLNGLDVSKNSNLHELHCYNNGLSALDVSQNLELTFLNCYENPISSLNLKNNTNLQYLNCGLSMLRGLDLSQNTKLETLNCQSNAFTRLDLSHNTNLLTLDCRGSAFFSLDLSHNTKLGSLKCSDTYLVCLDLSNNTQLNIFECDNSRSFRSIECGTPLSTLGFDSSKATEVFGGNFDGDKVNFTEGEISYTYDCGNGKSARFKMNRKHKALLVPEQPATCDAPGRKEHYACDCGALFEDEKAENPITEDQLEIPAMSHNWGETTYEWSDDGKTCTAKRTCKNNPPHEETESAAITSQISRKPTCTEKGETIYTATFKADWASEQTKAVEDVDALDHEWGELAYEWSGDGKTCTAKRTCQRDPSHEESKPASVSEQQTKAPTCAVKGETTYTATVEFDGMSYTGSTTRQDVPIDPKNHDNHIVEVAEKVATCTENGNTAHWRCSACNRLFNDASGQNEIPESSVIISALGHDAEKIVGLEPTYTDDGWKDYYQCRNCKKFYEEEECTAEIISLEDWKKGKGKISRLSSDSDDSDSQPSISPEKPGSSKPSTDITVSVKPTVTNDTAKVEISKETVVNAISKAEKEAEKYGSNIVVKIETNTKNAKHFSFKLPDETVDTLVKKKVKELRILTDGVDVTLNLDMLKEVQKQIDEDAHLIIQKTGSQWFTAETKNVIGNRPVYSFSITGANGKQLTNFGKGRVSVSLPYTHNAYENPAGLMAYYINKAGVAFPVPNSAYEAKSGTVSFVTDHFSYFAVGFRAPIAFSDITNHWAKSSIDYATVRGLLSGTGYGKFSPDAAITRGMLVTALGRLAEVNVSAYKTSSFTDVKAGAYYLPYVEWANKNGIMTGIGGGKFAPDQKVTREQMAVVVQNYAKAIGFELPKIRMENTFADVNEIGAFAKGAVKAVQMAGVLTGKDGNRFEPKGTVTRAEASVILERFARTRISTTSYVEGWVRNDSGKWMYYVSGKPVTGSRIIDGKSYVFDQNGVTAQKR